jgi:hypothetical protein
MRARVKSRQGCRKRRGAPCARGRGEYGTIPWPHENGVLVGPGTDGVHRARSDSDLTCVAWSNQTQERCQFRHFNHSKLLED